MDGLKNTCSLILASLHWCKFPSPFTYCHDLKHLQMSFTRPRPVYLGTHNHITVDESDKK